MKKMTIIFTALFVLLLQAPLAEAAPKDYIIGKGDALSVRVWGEGELSAEVVVRPDGKISLPGIGELRAAGITPRQLQGRITGALKDLVFEPLVSVSVNTFPANSMIVYGPGIPSTVISLTGKTTLLQILSSISPGANADLAAAYVERQGEKVASDFKTLFKEGYGAAADLEILAGDRLFIPINTARYIFVEGAVKNPKTVPYVENMTILEAIHQAGGFNKFADRNDTVITRQGQTGTEKIQVRMADLINNGDMSQNIPLRGGDLIVVDTSWF